jgi:hypothetical protein
VCFQEEEEEEEEEDRKYNLKREILCIEER